MSMKDRLRKMKELRAAAKEAENPKVVRLPVKPRVSARPEAEPPQGPVEEPAPEKRPAEEAPQEEPDSVGDMISKAFEAEASRAVAEDLPQSPEQSVEDMLAQAIAERAAAKKRAEQEPIDDGEEQEEETEPVEVLEGTVSRVFLGKLKSEATRKTIEETPWVFTLGTKPERAGRGYLKEVSSEPEPEEITGDSIYEQVTAAIPALRKHSIDMEEGPYADHEGLLEQFKDEVVKGAKTLSDVIERIIDMARPVVDPQIESIFSRDHESELYTFNYNEHFHDLPDELPTAGGILGQSSRKVTDPSSQGRYVMIADMLEPYMLAVSLLRRANVPAYPAFGIVPGETESFTPLVAILDEKAQVPLTTFALLRKQTPIGSVLLLSDQAMLAATYCMLAKNRTKHLTVEMVQQSKIHVSLEPEEVENQAHRIGDALVEAHKRWPGTHLISEVLNFLYMDVKEATTAMMVAEMQRNAEMLVAMHPEYQIPGAIEAEIDQGSSIAGDRIRGMALRRLERVIPKAPMEQSNGS
jgi:hypothetical protein